MTRHVKSVLLQDCSSNLQIATLSCFFSAQLLHQRYTSVYIAHFVGARTLWLQLTCLLELFTRGNQPTVNPTVLLTFKVLRKAVTKSEKAEAYSVYHKGTEKGFQELSGKSL